MGENVQISESHAGVKPVSFHCYSFEKSTIVWLQLFKFIFIATPLLLNWHTKLLKKSSEAQVWLTILSCYQLIFLAFGIIGKPCYSSLQWCAICYDYAIWGCAAHLNMGVGVKWNVPKCIAIVTMQLPVLFSTTSCNPLKLHRNKFSPLTFCWWTRWGS